MAEEAAAKSAGERVLGTPTGSRFLSAALNLAWEAFLAGSSLVGGTIITPTFDCNDGGVIGGGEDENAKPTGETKNFAGSASAVFRTHPAPAKIKNALIKNSFFDIFGF